MGAYAGDNPHAAAPYVRIVPDRSVSRAGRLPFRLSSPFPGHRPFPARSPRYLAANCHWRSVRPVRHVQRIRCIADAGSALSASRSVAAWLYAIVNQAIARRVARRFARGGFLAARIAPSADCVRCVLPVGLPLLSGVSAGALPSSALHAAATPSESTVCYLYQSTVFEPTPARCDVTI